MKIAYMCDYCGYKEVLDAYYWEADYRDTCSKCKSGLKKENIVSGDVFGYDKSSKKDIPGKYDVFGYNYKPKK